MAESAAQTASAQSGVTLIDVLPQHRFNEAALWAYLRQHLADFDEPATVRQFQGGQSNPTFLIETASQKRFVLRKKPPGKLLPSAHLIEREYRILKALPQQVPVPRVRVLCEDAEIIGTPFYLMDHIAGRVMTEVSLPGLSPVERRAIYIDFVEVAARLHAVDFRACGLGDFGKPERYIARQLERWTKQYLASQTEDNPDMNRLMAWLAERVPSVDETTIAHGDYRIGNVIMHPTEPRIIAVLDWELATLGHPLSDLAYACMYYYLPSNLERGGGLDGLDLAALGIPSERELIDIYCRAAGRDGIPNWTFFLAFANFRSAAITQGVYARALQGNAADQRGITYNETAKLFASIGWKLASNSKG